MYNEANTPLIQSNDTHDTSNMAPLTSPHMSYTTSEFELTERNDFIPSKAFPIPTGVPAFDHLTPQERITQIKRIITRRVLGVILDACSTYLVYYTIQQTVLAFTLYVLGDYIINWTFFASYIALSYILIPTSVTYIEKTTSHTESGLPKPCIFYGDIICILLNIGVLALFWLGFPPKYWEKISITYVVIQMLFILLSIIHLFFDKGPYVNLAKYEKNKKNNK